MKESLLKALIKRVDAQDPETLEELSKLRNRLNESAEKSKLAESKPRVPGTRWVPPSQVAAPVLAVHLVGPDRLTADYKREGVPEMAPGDHATAGNAQG